MKKLPEIFLKSLNGIEGFNKESFVKVHEQEEQVTSIRVNPDKLKTGNRQLANAKSIGTIYGNDTQNEFSMADYRLPVAGSVPWSQFGFYLKQRPSFTFDPLFHAGCYYVQEASSMFLEQALKQLLDLCQPLKVLDLCAAPGGKSTHIQSLISAKSLLVSNEIIKSRNLILKDNIIKWGCNNVIVTNNDPSVFQKLEGYFDVMVVDAPCSGSGLFRKDEEAIDEWSLNNVRLCSQRQQRILSDALPALKENGILIYSTCSYSKEEDEDVMDWLVEEMGMKNEKLKIKNDWSIVEASSPKTNSKAYRFYPDKLKGEGLFLCCFRKKQFVNESKLRPVKSEKISSKEKELIQPFITNDAIEILKEKDFFFGLPQHLLNEYAALRSVLNIQYAGTGIGRIMKERLVPEHSLALSTIVSDETWFTELSYEQSIKYLQRQDLNFETKNKGWQLVCYEGQNLGWINALPNRINNYYPKELRILKQQNDSAFEK